ncbi:GNAT family N-acetyltransferase [Sphingopyxis sp. MWB1]|uniref:GNAT family N-acetyltransferase n=1 Tax=Sphingopyxis sp. MWB1 TaxID=1537715 RepID=UPI00051A77ED|nr:GNAT family N-acetyltransferase [Sphingopyxis sp. MWB1]
MFARTERLLLRPGWQEDAPALARAIGDEMVIRNLARAPWPYGEEDARAFLAGWVEGNPSRFLMVRRTASAPRIIGCIGLDPMDNGDVELGYWVARPYWGLGYATEAGRHMIDLARTIGIKRLVASHFVDNPASGSVLRKLGFVQTGRCALRQSLGRGEAAPTIEYARDVAAAGNDGDDDDGPLGDMRRSKRWPEGLREEWRLHAA